MKCSRRDLLLAALPVGATGLNILLPGCASPVPGGGAGNTALSGRRLKVKLVFSSPVNPAYYYYFLINNSNVSSAPGPIPVGPPVAGFTYGNGFATGSDARSGGFTDFVLFSINQYPGGQPASNYALYHVLDGGDANNRSLFQANGVPVVYSSPTSTDGKTIYFEIDMAQLYPSSSQSAAVSQALAARWMQVNVVATNNTPVDGQTTIYKEYDSLGDDSDGRGSYQLVDLRQPAYVNGDLTLAATTTETTSNDTFVAPPNTLPQDPALNLVDWSIQITSN